MKFNDYTKTIQWKKKGKDYWKSIFKDLYQDYWNSENTALEVTVPIAVDASLDGGTVQLRGYWGIDAGAAVDIGSPQTISATGVDKTISIAKTTIEGLNGFGEGEVLKVIAIVTDVAGNSSSAGTESDDEITIDQTSPSISAPTIAATAGSSEMSVPYTVGVRRFRA